MSNLANETIKAKIDENNRKIEELMNPDIFTLNNAVAKILKENEELQSICKHEYKNGYCKYCYKEQN